MNIKGKYNLLIAGFKGETLLTEMTNHIKNVYVEYGDYGVKKLTAKEWFLHHEEIKAMPLAEITIIYKNETCEIIKEGVKDRGHRFSNFVSSRKTFIKALFYYFKLGLKDIKLIFQLKRHSKGKVEALKTL